MVRKPTNPRPAARDIRPESQLDPAAKATAVSTDDPGLHIPLSSQAVFWRPRHMCASPMLGQLPFVFWLMETLRPRNIVQLGLGDGLVYMALCQAAERLGGTTAIWGLQTAAGGLPPEFQAEHDAYYADFSTLMTAGPSRKIPGSLSEDEIDLLVMDAGTDAALPGQWNTEWLPRVSDRGVVLICNPDHLPDDADLRRDLLSGEGRSLIMDPVSAGTTGGIGIALRGGNVPGRLGALVAQRPGKPAYLAARRVFNRLGQGLEHMQHLTSQQTMIAAMQARLEAVEQQRGDVAERTEAQTALRSYLESRIDELRGEAEDRLGDIAALSEQVSRIPALQAERDALTQELSDLRPALREAQEKRSAHWARVEALQAEATTANSQIEALKAENALLKQAQDDRLGEIAALTLEREQRILQLQDDLRDAQEKRSAHWARVEALQAEATTKNSQIEALKAENALLKQAHEDRLGDIAALTLERDRSLAAAQQAVTGLEQRISHMQDGLREAQEKRSAHWARVEALMAENARLKQAQDDRLGEIATLTLERDTSRADAHRVAAELEHRIRCLQDDLREAQESRDAHQSQIERLIEDLGQSRSEVGALLASTSWRVTRPLRSVKQALRGRE